jgi:hypothetical protein
VTAEADHHDQRHAGAEPTGVIAAAASTLMNSLVPLRKNGEPRAFFELSGGSVFGDLQPVGRRQHEELNEDEGVPAAPGKRTVLRRVKRLEWEQFRGARF